MALTKYGDYFFDEVRRELIRKDMASQGQQWWRTLPHVPNDVGMTIYIQALQKLVWTKGRKFAWELRQSGDQPVTLYCNWYSLNGDAVVISLPVGLDLYALMTQGESAFLAVMDSVLMKVSEP